MPSLDPGLIERFEPCPFCLEPLTIDVETLTIDDDGKPDDVGVFLSCKNCDVQFHCSKGTCSQDDPHINAPEELLKWWNEMVLLNKCGSCHHQSNCLKRKSDGGGKYENACGNYNV